MKALRSLEQNVFYLHLDAFTKLTHDELKQKLKMLMINVSLQLHEYIKKRNY